MSSLTYVYPISSPTYHAFTMPSGFTSTVQVYLWGAGGGSTGTTSTGIAHGGGGGYVESTLTINPGDFVEIIVGAAGMNSSGMTPGLGGTIAGSTYPLFAGANGGVAYNSDNDSQVGAGAGGGGATGIILNNVTVAVAAGGGGAGGYAEYGIAGQSGYPGGTYAALTTTSQGGIGENSESGGGGGGGGYLGGVGGKGVGDDSKIGAYGGSGGENLGSITLPGSGIVSGGRASAYATVTPYGNAGYNGYAVLVFTRQVQIYNKVSGVWKQVLNTYQKINGIWTAVNQIYNKVNGTWTPLFSNATIPSNPGTVQYTTAGTYYWTVPANITSILVRMSGAGGGGGGPDSHIGYVGAPGTTISGIMSVTPGTTYTITIGTGGGGGGAGTGSSIFAPGQGNAAGGISPLGYNGGGGGYPGGSGWSGEGGGGGSATTLASGGSPIAVAGGGGGGGGGGNYSYGFGQTTATYNTGYIYGANGVDHSGDGGGSGGGGGGYVGGGAGPSVGGDNGGYSGSNGSSLLPSGFTQDTTVANNGGSLTAQGGSGSITIYY